jgi:membrane-associated phospholipid phosphatase
VNLASFKDLELSWLHRVMCHGMSEAADWLAAFVNDDLFGVPFFALLLLLWVATRPGREKVVRVLLTLVLAMGVGNGLREAVWAVAPRSRPAWERPRQEWLVGPNERMTCASQPDRWIDRSHPPRSPAFPSAHVTTATVAATALLLGSRAFGLVAWAYAILVGWGRLYWGKHWPSDVVGTMLLMAPLTWAVWRLVPRLTAWWAARRATVT